MYPSKFVTKEDIKKNKELCKKYRWLKPFNYKTGKLSKDYDYSYTWLDQMEEGWRIAFGEKFCEDVDKCVRHLGFFGRRKFRIIDMKEKFGMLVVTVSNLTEELDKVLEKYEQLSSVVCYKCGKPATKISTGYILPYCDDCADPKLKYKKLIKDNSYYW